MKFLTSSPLRALFFILFVAFFSVPQLARALPPQLSALRSSEFQQDCISPFLTFYGNSPVFPVSEGAKSDLQTEALAYLRFLWAGYINKFINVAQLKKVTMSNTPANPFREASPDSLEAGLQRAVAAKIANMSSEEWADIKSELDRIVPQLEKETAERVEAEEESSWIVRLSDPQIISEPYLIRRASSWYEHQGRVFLAANSARAYFGIFELDLSTGELKKVAGKGSDKLDTYSTPSWYAHEGHLYLATGSGRDFYVFEFDLSTNELIEKGSKKIGANFDRPAVWHQYEDHLYLAVGSPDRLYVLELVAGQLTERDSREIWGESGHLSWHTHGGRLFLALGTTPINIQGQERLYVFEFVKTKLIVLDNQPIGWKPAPASWHEQDGHVFLVVGLPNKHVKLFKLNLVTGLLEEQDDIQLSASVNTVTASYEHEGRKYLAFGIKDENMQILELVAGQLVKRATYPIKVKYLTWHMHNDQLFLAVSSDNSLDLFEYFTADNQLLKRTSWRIEEEINSAPELYSRENQLHLVVSDWNGLFYHFNNIFLKIKGRGR